MWPSSNKASFRANVNISPFLLRHSLFNFYSDPHNTKRVYINYIRLNFQSKYKYFLILALSWNVYYFVNHAGTFCTLEVSFFLILLTIVSQIGKFPIQYFLVYHFLILMYLIVRPKKKIVMLPSPDQNLKIPSFFFFFLTYRERVEFSNIFCKVSKWGKLGRNAVKTHIYKCFFKPLNTNFSKFFAQIWHFQQQQKKMTLSFRILRSVGRGQHNNNNKFGLNVWDLIHKH